MGGKLRGSVVLVVAVLCAGLTGGAARGDGFQRPVRDHDRGHWYERACQGAAAQTAACGAQVVSDANGVPLASTVPPFGALGPSAFHSGYSLPATSVSGTPTIGIVDAYDDPSIEADLAAYDAYYGLPACTTANRCFRKVNQNGRANYPSGTSWHLEIALDVETAHELCQNCKILLVVASSNSITDLGTAVNRAVRLGADVVSNSYGTGEYAGETGDEGKYFNHPGVMITASSGDGGYGVEFPAASRYVTAVGGTTLQLNGDRTWASEAVWSGTGSGCSAYEPKPAWQTDTGCARRTVVDVSADADPNTGAAVYDSIGAKNGAAWYQVGGTSLATPLIGAAYALTGDTSGNFGSIPYAHAASLHDVASGSNGSCSPSYLCTAAGGFDGPTGLGTPNGLTAFVTVPPAPDFSLSAIPSSKTIVQGAGTTYGVTLTPVDGFSGSVALGISGLPAGVTGSFNPRSIRTSSSASSTLTLTSTSQAPPGTYPLVINGTAGAVTRTAAASLVVSALPAPTLTASPSSVGPGGSVTAAWANVAAPTTTDWIGVFVPGAASTAYVSRIYDSSCTATVGRRAKAAGSCVLTMPTAPGTYELRLLAQDTSTLVVFSGSITVVATKASPTLSTQASPGVVLGGAVFDTATLASGSSPTGSITFALYGPGDTTCSKAPATTSTLRVTGNGTYAATTFTPSVPGTYLWVASYTGDADNNAVAGACGASPQQSVTVGPAGPSLTVSTTSTSKGSTITVSWNGVSPPRITDWIGVFVPGAANTAYLGRIYDSSCSAFPFSFLFASAQASGSCTFRMPTAAGTYELRLLASGGPTLLAISPPIVVS